MLYNMIKIEQIRMSVELVWVVDVLIRFGIRMELTSEEI